MDNPDDRLLTSREAAALLCLSERTMERHRVAGTGPRYIQLGRSVRYRRHDLADHIERAACQSTSEAAQRQGQRPEPLPPRARQLGSGGPNRGKGDRDLLARPGGRDLDLFDGGKVTLGPERIATRSIGGAADLDQRPFSGVARSAADRLGEPS